MEYLTDQTSEIAENQSNIVEYLQLAELEKLEDTLKSLYASIPYNSYVNNNISSYEGYFVNVLYAYFSGIGLDIVAEDVTNKGRIDLTIKLNKYCYIIEFKVDQNGKAIEQIKKKNYIEKYLYLKNEGWDIYLIGIDFSSENKNIKDFVWEKV